MRNHRAAMIGLGVLFLVAAWAEHAWPWGDLGHKVVCESAFQEMNPNARAEVRRLIRKDPEFKFFAESCMWPDHRKQRANEHFINVPRDLDKITTDQCATAPVCLFTAIKKDLAVLSTSTSSDQAKLDSLKFLGHWMGDLHQPLHVSFEDDRGGGEIRESGPCSSNLDGVWDTCIIEEKLGTDWRSIGRAPSEIISESDRATWTATKVDVWPGESYAIARGKDTEYCVTTGNKWVYEPGNETYDAGETEKVVVVDDAYLERQEPIVTERLKRAGVRLAHLLNTTLGK